jgi:SAM-dependent methyltransferase
VGVGYGFFLSMLEKDYGLGNLHGMDPFPKSIEIASSMTSARIVGGDITDERWPFEPDTFDVVTCFDVVEHLEEPDDFFRMVRTVLKPGGTVVVTTPNLSLPYRMRSIPLIGIPDANPTHINIRRPSYWRGLAEDNGFNLIAEWRGEHLSHVRLLPRILRNLCRALRIDHRKIPIINSFEQAYCMILELRRSSA